MVVGAYEQQRRMNVDIHASPQEIEGQALIELAGRLSQAVENVETDGEHLKEQVRLNWRVWTIIQSYLVDKDCELPGEIRDNLLSLTRFIDQQTIEFLLDMDVSRIPSLININRQIGAGLLKDPAEARAEEVARQAKGEGVNDNNHGEVGPVPNVVSSSSRKKVTVTRIQGG
jgi:flagellar biosynthesis regulator FlaF